MTNLERFTNPVTAKDLFADWGIRPDFYVKSADAVMPAPSSSRQPDPAAPASAAQPEPASS